MTLDLLRIPNLVLALDGDAPAVPELAELARRRGRFAFVHADEGRVVLARDGLGLNKLFACIHGSEGVIVASYLTDLRDRGVPFEAIFSVPAGVAAEVDLAAATIRHERFFSPQPREAGGDAALQRAAKRIRDTLLHTLAGLCAHAGERVAVCLSGGIDSSVVAAFVAEVFDDVHAYTYSYREGPDGRLSDDAVGAEAVAEALRLDLTIVAAGDDEILAAVDEAIEFGQDWRDFNVHCAVVNVLLARAIAERSGPGTVVFTGDLMNELMADYAPIRFNGNWYYSLPNLPFHRLRRTLVSGLQTGDREVGVFGAFGLTAAQPYAFCCDSLLAVPSDVLAESGKVPLMELIAEGRLGGISLRRPKIRAQIGDTSVVRGILPVLVRSGRDAAWLRRRFAERFDTNEGELNRFVRGGVYRSGPADVTQASTLAEGYVRV
jgi:asparagine synthetase B (glutamine-hydrolysing)